MNKKQISKAHTGRIATAIESAWGYAVISVNEYDEARSFYGSMQKLNEQELIELVSAVFFAACRGVFDICGESTLDQLIQVVQENPVDRKSSGSLQ